MKNLYASIFILFILACNTNKESDKNESIELVQTEKTNLQNQLDWLLGDWKRKNDSEGNQTFETWMKRNENEYFGIGYTLKNQDTLSKEQMTILHENGNWILKVQTLDENQPTIFKMTSLSENEFICENDSIEFPKKIHYWLNGNQMNAKISNEHMEIAFVFEKMN